MLRLIVSSAVVLALATPAAAQLPSLGKIQDAVKKVESAKKALDDLNITEDEEIQLGSEISAMLRQQYGVVQDKAVHKYVALDRDAARASQ